LFFIWFESSLHPAGGIPAVSASRPAASLAPSGDETYYCWAFPLDVDV